MKLLHLILILILFTPPLYSGNDKNRTPPPSNNINIGVMIGIAAVFGIISFVEWYTQRKTTTNNQKDAQNAPESIDLKDSSVEKSSSLRPPFVPEPIIAQPSQDSSLKEEIVLTSILPAQQIPKPTEPALPPQPSLQPSGFPEDKRPMIIHPKLKKTAPKKPITKQDDHKNNASAYELNDPINGKY